MSRPRARVFPAVMALLFLLLTIQLLLVLVGGLDSTDHQHVFSDSFPRNDEYDIMALEPETPYGTPYGGFSRATASRLASLPLKLPSISKEVPGSADDAASFEPIYTTVRDNFGREFACRVYHEDELEADSLGDSMFDTPRLRKTTTSSEPAHETETTNESNEENVPVGSSDDENSKVLDLDGEETSTATSSSKLSEIGFDPIMLGHTIHKRLSELTGLCAQLHPHTWWSYEWCHQENVKQFHVKVTRIHGKAKRIELEDVTNLGSFSGRTIQVATEEEDPDSSIDPSKTLAQGRKELGRVFDTFVGGDICPQTGKPRVTQAEFRCCSQANIARNKGGVLRKGKQEDTNSVSIYEATEDKSKMCHYNITICTSLMCDDYDDGEGKSPSAAKISNSKGGIGGSNNKNSMLNLELDPAEAEKLSVTEILERTFGKPGNFCMRSQTGGWWSYEFCPGDYVRQFHEDEASLVDQLSGIIKVQAKATPASVSEHFLGRFIPEDHEGITKENEWKYVVNATTSITSPSTNRKSQSGPAAAGGNGAYYVQEYTKGDVCDQVDVTDSAIKAGEFGEGGIERAITLRYSCNSELSMTVKEDSTCHYVIDISIPTLCHHPLFKAPVSKKQVVKCLPIA